MNVGYFIILFLYAVILQIPCFLSLLITYPIDILFGHDYRISVSLPLLIWGCGLINRFIIKMKIFYDDKVDRTKKYVRMGNHSSYIDSLIISNMKQTSMTIAINYSKYIPLIGWNMWLVGIPFVDKNNKRKSITEMYIDFLTKKKDSNIVLSIFPTGKRVFTDDFELDQIKTGGFVIAKALNLDIVPIYHNIIDCFNDVTKEYNPFTQIYCIHGDPISTKDKDVEQLKIEYYEATLRLRDRVKNLINQNPIVCLAN